ncbi:8-amino-7-oxononanoate synthase [Mucilaginibacter sp. 14171R-50]|uniref:aminotransferase class I/II-fold pyridoxal phosphate-dependent enzyme n=1 Tax=Mucilaginibacter sp. 14171R-50 TaxID=2703789 RepID=UPI00138B411B|nr:8-amino-7-oxononanoate synthase [Mucilaginibacter sp. 14171R-50]QHS57353.1 8-amino-7-oxononanoate synthase [Mucilaginibacter sp. 14171R-50]
MASSEKYMQSKLDERKVQGNYRTLRPEGSMVDFCSNDYLGFARSPVLKDNIRRETESYPQSFNGATGSRLISGNSAYTEELEAQIAAFHQAEAGLMFNSGYDANVGLFSSLPQKGDTIICDELVHASIIDGARLSYANRYTFRHNDLESLEGKLKNAKGICYVVIESVYSMDGDTPPIAEILQLTQQYGGHLIVDEAHAVGLYPAGLINHLNLQDKVFTRLVTFSKALGCHGAIVLGSDLLREYLINFARSFIYTTAAPFHQLAAIKAAYNLLKTSSADIEQLHANIMFFKRGIEQSHDRLLQSNSAIQCIILNSNERAKRAAAQLQYVGLDVRAILSPTVAQGSERIRICIHAYNTAEEIGLLTSTINNIIHEI